MCAIRWKRLKIASIENFYFLLITHLCFLSIKRKSTHYLIVVKNYIRAVLGQGLPTILCGGENLKRNEGCWLGGSGGWSVVWYLEVCAFDSWSGHIPWLHVGSLVRARERQLINVSLALSLFLSLSLKVNKHILRVRILKKKEWRRSLLPYLLIYQQMFLLGTINIRTNKELILQHLR